MFITVNVFAAAAKSNTQNDDIDTKKQIKIFINNK